MPDIQDPEMESPPGRVTMQRSDTPKGSDTYGTIRASVANIRSRREFAHRGCSVFSDLTVALNNRIPRRTIQIGTNIAELM
jgi:hypothetical protein